MRLLCVLVGIVLVVSGLAGIVHGQDDDIILRVAMQDDMRTTNPLTAGDVWTWNVLDFIFDRAVIDNPYTNEPMLYIAVGTAATSTSLVLGQIGWTDCDIGDFDYSPESTWAGNESEAIVFYDFENVYWHDGEQMDIRDILFSFHVGAQVPEWSSSVNCLKDNGGRAPSNFSTDSFLHIYPAWESDDGLQAALKFVLQEPYSGFFSNTLSTLLLPEHIWAFKVGNQEIDGAKIWCDPGFEVGGDDAWDVEKAQEFDNSNPVGSGPFVFEEWQKGQYSKISTYRDHFFREGFNYEDYCLDNDGNTLARQPYIDGIIYKIYKTAEAAVLALKNNDIDYIAWSVPPTFVQELANEPGVALQGSPTSGFFCLTYNMRRKSFGYNETGHDVGKPLRQAIAHCIDKNWIVQRVLLNIGIGGEGPVSSISPWFNDSIPRYGFDPDKGKEILQNAGYIEPDWGQGDIGTADNHWLNPDGSEIGSGENGLIKILAPPYPNDHSRTMTTPADAIAANLRGIGIYAEAVNMDFGSILDMIGVYPYTSPGDHAFDMFTLGWYLSSDPTEYLYDLFDSSQADYGYNYPGYNNESFDGIIDLARQTEDPEIKLKAIQDAQASIVYDLPLDVLYYQTNIEAYRDGRFTGWKSECGTVFNRWSIYNIRLPTTYKVKAQFVSPPSAVVSNSTHQITVFVKDQDGNPLSGAEVEMNVSAGSLDLDNKETTSGGKATFTWTAPYADPNNQDIVNNGTKVIIQIETATYDEGDHYYDPAPSRLTLITVYPEEVPFLSVRMSADPDVIDPDYNNIADAYGFVQIEVLVTDENTNPVPGADIAVYVTPAIPELSPTEAVTDADGKATFTLTSTNLPDDDDSTREYIITAYAEFADKSEAKPGENSISIFIVDGAPEPLPPDPIETDFIGTHILIFVFLTTSAIYATYRRRLIQKPPGQHHGHNRQDHGRYEE